MEAYPQQFKQFETRESQSDIETQVQVPKSGRLVSLDVFRGLTILAMLLVNNLAGGEAAEKALGHAPWNGGMHLADLVFPFFLFIVGVAVPYASASRKKKGLTSGQYILKSAGRMLVLIFLGCLIDSSIARRPMFTIDVLQLIGMAYFVGALLYELPVYWRIPIAAVFLLAHWSAIRFVPIPNVGAGIFTEKTNLVSYVDQTYLRPIGISGIISVIPTSALVIVGTVIGDILRNDQSSKARRALLVMVSGLILAGIGLVWNVDLPFNKPLWTASYITFTAGLATLLLGFLYFGIDVRGIKRWSFPFEVFGTNAIVAYVLPILVKLYILRVWTFQTPGGVETNLQSAAIEYCRLLGGATLGGWLYTILYILFWWIVLLQFYRKKVFLHV